MFWSCLLPPGIPEGVIPVRMLLGELAVGPDVEYYALNPRVVEVDLPLLIGRHGAEVTAGGRYALVRRRTWQCSPVVNFELRYADFCGAIGVRTLQ